MPPPAPVGIDLEPASAAPATTGARDLPPAAPGAREQPAERSPAVAATGEGALCKLPDTAVEAIHFAPEEFNLFPRGEQILDGVLACQQAGLLGDQALHVIGYSDPRGSAEYNRRLALARAAAVKRYLVRRGVPAGLVIVESQGESCHLGSGPESWGLDRRVEIHATSPGASHQTTACR